MIEANFSTGGGPAHCRYLSAAVPPGLRIYALTDIHGRLDLLERCLEVIDQHRLEHPIARVIHVFLGDYIDRGKWSRGTIERLIARGRETECVFLKGNHEQVAMQGMTDLDRFSKWMRIGGAATLQSYGVATATGVEQDQLMLAQKAIQQAIPREHFQFLAQLRHSYSCGDFFFAHAGIRPGIPFHAQRDEDLLWIRRPFLDSTEDFGKVVVHGHTPQPAADIRCNRVNIDTGAFATGRLTCFMLEGARKYMFDTGLDVALQDQALTGEG